MFHDIDRKRVIEVCVVNAVQSSGSGDVMKEKTVEPDSVVFLEERLDTTHNLFECII